MGENNDGELATLSLVGLAHRLTRLEFEHSALMVEHKNLKRFHDAMDARIILIERLSLQIRTVVYTVLLAVMAFGFGGRELIKSLWIGVVP